MNTPDGYQEFDFPIEDKPRRVFWRGEGPGVLILHELPGMSEACLELGRIIAKEGFRVYLPLMFGKPGEHNALLNLVRVCLQREFNLWSKNAPSRITTSLRELSRHIHSECGGKGIGAIGMCLTGNVVISLMVDEHLMAPILSQPSLPLTFFNAEKKASLGVPAADIDAARNRNIPVLGLKFELDPVCPKARFATLQQGLGENFDGFVIEAKDYEQHNIEPRAHAVLTDHFRNQAGHPTREALDKVLDLLKKQLK
ncbi:MAG: dienelactone hydrolase family protein [Blastocatellia bacterium]